MDIYDNNINVLTNYIADGSKGRNSNAVRVELEHFVIYKNGDCVPYINGVVINTTSLLNRVHKLKSV